MTRTKKLYGVYWVGALTKGWVLGKNENPLRFHEDEAKKYADKWNTDAQNGSYIVQRLDEDA